MVVDPNRACHRWATMAGADLLPAVPEHGAARTASLANEEWTGETPTVIGGDGRVRRFNGWAAAYPDGMDLEGWLQDDMNLLLQHRRIKGLRVKGGDRARRVYEEAQQYLDCSGFPFVRTGVDVFTMMFRVEGVGHLAPQTNPAGDVQFLSAGDLTLVYGPDRNGYRSLTMGEPQFIAPPTLSLGELERIWRDIAGGNPRRPLHRKEHAASEFLALRSKDPATRFLIENGWAVGFDEWGVDCKCPFHKNSAQPARFIPAALRRGASPAFRCTHAECRKRPTVEFFAAMGYPGAQR